jgi:hypothetical protein
VVATYFRLCDTLGPETDWAAMEALFTRDARWEGQGVTAAPLVGMRDAAPS